MLGLRQNGGAHAHISRTIKRYGIDTSHFHSTGVGPGQQRQRMSADEILVRRPDGARRVKPHLLRRALVESGVLYQCALCGNPGEWQGVPLTLQIDHVDGDFLNNTRENLRFLCPNCHRLTPNFAGHSAGRFTLGHARTSRAAPSA